MLSPTLALRCPHCQHALALPDIRGGATCPACGELHGLPPAVADALALYERAIQQAVADLVHASPVPTTTLDGPPPPRPPPPRDSAPQPAQQREPAPPARPPAATPFARLLAAPLPAAAPNPFPNTLLSIGPAARPAPPVPADSSPPSSPVPTDSPAGPILAAVQAGLSGHVPADSPAAEPAVARAGFSSVPADSPAQTLEAPIAARSLDPAALSGPNPDPSSFGGVTAEHLVPGVPTVERDPSGFTAVGGPSPTAPPISVGPASLSALGVPDSVPGASAPSNSSLLSIVYGRSGARLAAAPLQVAAVREPADAQPARSASDLVAAVRSVLPDRPDITPGPEPEGRIPAAALAVARRTLLARHADERRQQLVREGSLGLIFIALVGVGVAVAGYWYIAAVIAVFVIGLRLRREERAERFGAEVQRLADALGGLRLPTHDAIGAWFDSLWPAPVSPEAMWTSHLHGAVRCHVHGYAALVDVHLNEKTAGGVVYPPRITAYLAGMWPGRVPSLRGGSPDLTPDAQARLTRLRKAGYTVVADAHGGLIMRASEAIAQAARADITRLPALQVPIGELADLARDLGAEPVPSP